MAIINFLAWVIYQLIDIYILVIVIWCLLSWFPNARGSRLGEIVNRLVEPYMRWFFADCSDLCSLPCPVWAKSNYHDDLINNG